jgi:hypothetical protein
VADLQDVVGAKVRDGKRGCDEIVDDAQPLELEVLAQGFGGERPGVTRSPVTGEATASTACSGLVLAWTSAK